jgi:hypothetical protein
MLPVKCSHNYVTVILDRHLLFDQRRSYTQATFVFILRVAVIACYSPL